MENIDLTKKAEYYKHKNLLAITKMAKEILTFGNIKIENKISVIRLLLL